MLQLAAMGDHLERILLLRVHRYTGNVLSSTGGFGLFFIQTPRFVSRKKNREHVDAVL